MLAVLPLWGLGPRGWPLAVELAATSAAAGIGAAAAGLLLLIKHIMVRGRPAAP